MLKEQHALTVSVQLIFPEELLCFLYLYIRMFTMYMCIIYVICDYHTHSMFYVFM